MDPIAIRLTVAPDGANALKLGVDVRVLPLIDESEYNRIGRMVGRAKITTPSIGSGLRMAIGIGADASLRRDLIELSHSSPLGERIALDWLGDWALFGVEDGLATVRSWVALASDTLPQAPQKSPGSERRCAMSVITATALRTPAYLARSASRARSAPPCSSPWPRNSPRTQRRGVVAWNEGPAYKGQRTVHIAIAAGQVGHDAPGGDIWYALTGDALMFTLSEEVLHHLLDERHGGKGTRAAAKPANEPQLVLEWASAVGGPLRTLFGWLLETGALESSKGRRRAENFLRGAPGASLGALALAYEGAEPVPPDGGHYTLAADGVRDAARGSAILTRWPPCSSPGSPVARLMSAVLRFRGELAFDDEPHVEGVPHMQSLHARVELGLKP